MIVVSNASPLISLSRIGRLELLRQVFTEIIIPSEVFQEVVIDGAGRPAAAAVGTAGWITKKPCVETAKLAALRNQFPQLGAGETATVQLAHELRADLAIIDERAARRLAVGLGLKVIGSIGVLEAAFRRGLIADLRSDYQQLLATGTRIDPAILNRSLAQFGLPLL